MSQGDDGAAASQSDFHTYHYFATEGFLPGYGSLSRNRRSVSTLQLYPHAVVEYQMIDAFSRKASSMPL